ncbi:ATP-dependent protease La [Coprinopsis sp. MPI-PUGE-AT-0042]|nr:ATP-dependent protease La [Coprinopsis sp. MPI-PUGE-AT-0042]
MASRLFTSSYHTSTARSLLSSRRLFSQSAPTRFQASPASRQPRWINSKTGEEDGEDGTESDKSSGKSPQPTESDDSSSSVSTSSGSSSASSSSSTPASSPPPQSDSIPPSPTPAPSPPLTKPQIPSSYPYPLLALPIARRPLFPGFYKAVVIKNPAVVAAIKEMMKRGQPYLGAFLLKEKDSSSDKDVIDSLDEVHDVGVFCQVTSVFAAATPSSAKDGQLPGTPGGAPSTAPVEEALTAVLYPHRRIRITELVQPGTHHNASPLGADAFGARPEVHVVEEASEEVQEAVNEAMKDKGPTPVEMEGEETENGQLATPPSTPVSESGPLSSESTSPGTLESYTAPSDAPPDAAASSSSEAPSSSGATPTSFLTAFNVSLVRITNLATLPYAKDNQHIRAFTSEIVSVFKDIAQLNPLFRDQITNFSINQVTSSNIFDEPDKLADFAAAVSSGEPGELQGVLEAVDVEDRLRKALVVLKKELINAELASKLSRDVDSKIAKRQREYYLMEQLRNIKRELGMESDGKEKLIEQFRERAKGKNFPEAVKKVFDEELQKLSMLEPGASEANVTRNYLDWITSLPWGVHTPENYNLAHGREILDADHYGLSQVKDRILEFLAVGKLRGSVQGKIVCLVGPPGVGKTSVGRSIARCVGRRFVRISVGGLTDVAEIKGHRRTYVGALPGKIIQSLKRVETENPLVLIDEIDKIGRGHNGDPASALLEMLDPEQNGSFLDHYLDLPVDLSRVLFVCTANTLDTIPPPLLDRMEVLEVSGYVSEEKSQIAQKYLGPQAKEACGLKDADVDITPEAVDQLIKWYARESGVRNLKKYIEKIYRKAALKIVNDLGEEKLPEPKEVKEADAKVASSESAAPASTTASTEPSSTDAPPATNPSTSDTKTEKAGEALPTSTVERKPMSIPSSVHVRITPENLKEYVGPAIYQKDRMFGGTVKTQGSKAKKARLPPPGVSTGLGYLGNGSGAVMPIEAMSMPGKGSLQLTGKLGEVIRESAQIALSWVKAHAYELGLTTSPNDVFLADRDIHVHMPEGAVGKEGPSAGTALLVAFVSLFKNVRVDSDIALTGEISLSGQVLPVGGLKEKILAAHRAEIKTIIAPEAVRPDVEENVPDSVKEGIRIVYVENVEEVLEEVFKIRVGELANESPDPSPSDSRAVEKSS